MGAGVNFDDLNVDRAALADICSRYGIARLDVFGSVSRGDAAPDSDIDLLYSLADGARLGWEIDDLADELATLFGRSVDLIARTALHRRLRDQVLAEAKPLHAA